MVASMKTSVPLLTMLTEIPLFGVVRLELAPSAIFEPSTTKRSDAPKPTTTCVW